jgi:hypothetical protein
MIKVIIHNIQHCFKLGASQSFNQEFLVVGEKEETSTLARLFASIEN